jgi:hypothetical protein
MARALELEFLSVIPSVFTVLALAAWALTFGALARGLWRHALGRTRRSSATV